MTIRFDKRILAPIGIAIALAACEHEDAQVNSRFATTTAAVIVANDAAVLDVAKARCRRADECNRLGSGHKYADRDQCTEAYANQAGDTRILTCPNGVDKARLNKCLAELADQVCDAHMGPVAAMPDCESYCSSGN
jgi:hypothetical protein